MDSSGRIPRSRSARRSSARARLRHRRLSAGAADLRGASRRRAATSRCRRTRRRARRSPGATPPAPTSRRRSSTTGSSTPAATTASLTAYDAKTGERIYRARVGGGGSFAASPIAADGRLYFANEDGDVIVARAGRKYEELAKNPMKEVIMSTPGDLRRADHRPHARARLRHRRGQITPNCSTSNCQAYFVGSWELCSWKLTLSCDSPVLFEQRLLPGVARHLASADEDPLGRCGQLERIARTRRQGPRPFRPRVIPCDPRCPTCARVSAVTARSAASRSRP